MEATTDWQIGKKLPDRMKYMLDNQLMCDVTFHVGSEQTPIKAHKCILASASPVFYSMFDGPLAEKGIVSVPDIDVDIFNDILAFIYLDMIVEVNADNIKGLLYGSDKYMLQTLKDHCSEYLKSNIDIENVCAVLQAAHDFHLKELETTALQFIYGYGEFCLKHESFLTLSAECVNLIIDSDSLRCKEEFLFDKMIEWVSSRIDTQNSTTPDEQIRKELGKLLYQIRFPIMERKVFTKKVSFRRILTSDEIISVYQSFDDEDIDLFSKQRRKATSVKFIRCTFYHNSKNGWDFGGLDDCVDFKLNFDAVLSGIILFGSKTYSGRHEVKLNIRQSYDVLNSTNTNFHSSKGREMYDVILSDPLPLEKDVQYTIQLTIKGPQAFTGINYTTNVIAEDNLSVTFLAPSIASPNGVNITNGPIVGMVLTPLS